MTASGPAPDGRIPDRNGADAPLVPDDGPPASDDAPLPDEPDLIPGELEASAPTPARLGTGTFTIEGRRAPGLFVVGWLATILGVGICLVAVLATAGGNALLLLVGLGILALGLISLAGSQGLERRARDVLPYQGPSPLLVLAPAIPLSVVAGALVGVVLLTLGVDVEGPVGQLASIAILALLYVALIRLLVVDAGALTWAQMGVRRLDRRAFGEIAAGAAWAVPVIVLTIPIAAFVTAWFGVTPESPLPPTGQTGGFVLQLIAGALIAPFGEELLFRGLATTAWVRALGPVRGIVRGALVFALAHIIGVSGTSFGESFALAVVAFGSRVPVSLALGWLFVRRGSIWASFGLHATFNAILLIVGEVAARSIGA